MLVRYIFNYHSNKANFKFLHFVDCLRQIFKHIDPHVHPGHLNVSLLAYIQYV